MNDARNHPCKICGAAVAPYGYRMAGHFSTLQRKSYLWACADCRPIAEGRWRAANAPAGRAADEARNADVQPKAGSGGSVHSKAPDPKQGALDL